MNDNMKVVTGNESLDISNKFYGNLKKDISLFGETSGNQLNLEWIDKINDAVPYIDNIFDNPRRFIIGEEEVLNIEKSKKVTIESIKHLAKHSNFISEYNEETDDVKPSKLLNVLKEETYNTYENRFAYTLVDLIDSFVHRMEEKMNNTFVGKSDKLFCDANSKVDKEDIRLQIKMVTNKEVSNKNVNNNYGKKIDSIKSRINAWKSSVVYVSLKKEKAAKVTNPLKRTNVLLKNPNFKIAASLWDFLHSYEEKLEELKSEANNYAKLSPELQKIVDNSLLMYYIITKMGVSKSKYEYDEYRKYVKSTALDFISNTSEVLMEDFDMTESELSQVISNMAVQYKNKKVMDNNAVVSKISAAIKKFTEKVDNSYFVTMEGDKEVYVEDNKEDIEDNI